MEIQTKILLVDDEPDIIINLENHLRKEGFSTYSANNGNEGIEKASLIKPALIILDIVMPEMDGIEACRQLRELPELNNTSIAFLTSRTEDYAQIAGFNAGADDYIFKPVKPGVFISRVKALIRRGTYWIQSETVLTAGDIVIDLERYTISKKDKEYYLPRKQFELLTLLASKPQKVFRREEMIFSLWGADTLVNERAMDVHVRKIREKFGDEIIKTVKGIGYKFV